MADAPSRVLAETRCTSAPGARCPFSIRVPDALIDQRRDYVLSARGVSDRGGAAQPVGTVASHPWRACEAGPHRLMLEELD